jgi:hypothetical protein
MIASIKIGAASLALAVACTAHADDAPPAAVPAQSPAMGQMVVRDAATGRLRGPTPEEAAALHAAGPQALRGARRQGNVTRSHPSGATGARLDDSAMSYVVVVRQPDGRLAEYCFASQEAAEAALASPASAPTDNGLPTE